MLELLFISCEVHIESLVIFVIWRITLSNTHKFLLLSFFLFAFSTWNISSSCYMRVDRLKGEWRWGRNKVYKAFFIHRDGKDNGETPSHPWKTLASKKSNFFQMSLFNFQRDRTKSSVCIDLNYKSEEINFIFSCLERF